MSQKKVIKNILYYLKKRRKFLRNKAKGSHNVASETVYISCVIEEYETKLAELCKL